MYFWPCLCRRIFFLRLPWLAAERRARGGGVRPPGLKGVDPAVGQKIVKEARKWLGTKYVYGGKTRKGTDCSGMVMVVYEQVTGIKLPRDSHSQQAFTEHIKRRDLTPGDLVFFASKAGGSRIGHVGIYIGQGQFIHASSSRA